jgi:hypothetical protein
VKRKSKEVIAWLNADRANTAEENTNRGLWWIIGIIAVAIVAGVAFFVVGHTMSQAQGGASSMTSSMSSQQGLDMLAQQAENGNVTGGSSSVGTGYKGP